MATIRILADGSSPQEKAQARGKLFEKLMADVLRNLGYKVDPKASVNYAGMEIDIEGSHIVTGIPLYAECKCHVAEIDAPDFQKFFGKYSGLWFKNNKCHGLFIALPGLNSHAKGFYNENCKNNQQMTVRLIEEEEVLNSIYESRLAVKPEVISRLVGDKMGSAGDSELLYTDKGLFWLQYVIPKGGAIPQGIAIFDRNGKSLSDEASLQYLTKLYPQIEELRKIIFDESAPAYAIECQDVDQIVEVKGSSTFFEYQYPASPEHFVGRKSALKEIEEFISEVISKRVSSRGVLFEANSGFGKSSLVLSCVSKLKDTGHFAIAIDSRSASSSQFILQAISHSLKKFGNFSGLFSDGDHSTTLTGFDGLLKSLVQVGDLLKNGSRVMVVFFDQFENIFQRKDILEQIINLLLKLEDTQTNVIIGFSWKMDLIGLQSEFPYQLRDTIINSTKHIYLDKFADTETKLLLQKLSSELKKTLRKDLEFFLSEFSQGYPWLLKKLCAHVKSQIDNGVTQSEISHTLLNIKDLFQEDLKGLTAEEDGVLRKIARTAPIIASELVEDLNTKIVQSLVNRRLVVQIGNKLDIYWDIFRDYLNSGSVPVQENYILRSAVSSIFSATKLLSDSKGTITRGKFMTELRLSEKSFLNFIRDMRLLGIAEISSSKVELKIELPAEGKDFDESLRVHIREMLKKNRLVWRLMDTLESKGNISISEVADSISRLCPYISATKKTWITYARTFADWMDACDLGLFDRREGSLSYYVLGKEIREHRRRISKRTRGIPVPYIQYGPVEKVAIKLVEAARGTGRADWSGLPRSTVAKSLATLEDIGFIARKESSITLMPVIFDYVLNTEIRRQLFSKRAIKIESFAKFIEILNENKELGATHHELGIKLSVKLACGWKESTAKTNAKIMLNWARHLGLAPGVFAMGPIGRRKKQKKAIENQNKLFTNNGDK